MVRQLSPGSLAVAIAIALIFFAAGYSVQLVRRADASIGAKTTAGSNPVGFKLRVNSTTLPNAFVSGAATCIAHNTCKFAALGYVDADRARHCSSANPCVVPPCQPPPGSARQVVCLDVETKNDSVSVESHDANYVYHSAEPVNADIRIVLSN